MNHLYAKFVAIFAFVCIMRSFGVETEMKAKASRLRDIIYKRTGGQVVKPGSQKGVAGVVNIQKKVDISDLGRVIQSIAKTTKFNFLIKCEPTMGVNPANAAKTRKDYEFNVVVYVVDSNSDPNVIIMNQDAGWAIVNVANIDTSNKDRAVKIVARALINVCGGASTQYDNTLVSPINKYEDLDEMNLFDIPLDALSRFNKTLTTKGMTPACVRSYKIACEEGWAPVPTNEFQRAIWDKVHAIPKTPIRIEFDPKKGQ